MLVQVGKQQLLLGVAPDQVNTLHVLDRSRCDRPASPRHVGHGREARRLCLSLLPPASVRTSSRF